MKEYSLGPAGTGITVKIIRILFGFICISIALSWMIFSIKALKTDRSLWVTVIFLCGFGLYQIWAGLGLAARYIRIDENSILLKMNSFLPARKFTSVELGQIDLYPMSISFREKNGKKTVLRFGTVYSDFIDPVKDEIEDFASKNKISVETITEDI